MRGPDGTQQEEVIAYVLRSLQIMEACCTCAARAVQYCTAMICTAMRCTAMSCTAIGCAVVRCTAGDCTAIRCTAVSNPHEGE
jgi:hypothetical protein